MALVIHRPRIANTLAAVLTACTFGVAAAPASAAVVLCVPSAAGARVTSGGGTGSCASGTSKVALPSGAAAQRTLIALLPYMSFSASGIAGKPTITVTHANLQVVDGAGRTQSTNGTGKLVIGYDENPSDRAQTGSHDLIIGTEQSWTGYAQLVAGLDNTATGNYTAATPTAHAVPSRPRRVAP
jgi:hypothetical protein